MCRIDIRAEGELPEDKVSKETIDEITTELRKFSPNMRVQVNFHGVRTIEGV